MRSPGRSFLALMLLPLVFGSIPVHAQSAGASSAGVLDMAEEADLHFRLGVEAYIAGSYRQALVHLLESNRLARNKNVIFNIARAYEQLGQYEEAYRHYSDFLVMETDPARQKEASVALAALKKRVALLEVQSRPAGATIYVDRKDLGARGTAPRSLALEPGKHTVIVEMDGYEPSQSKPIDIQTGTESVVILDLKQIMGTVSLEGGPKGALVRIDKEDSAPVGVLPGTFEAPPGNHVLIVSAPGYQTLHTLVQVVPKETIQAVANLDLVTGTLVINAAERGARIEIDGVAAGFTPAVLPAVASGTHTLRVTLPGYRPFEEKIEIRPDQQTEVTARLRSLQEVTAASRSAESIEDAPASVTLIPQEEIRTFGYETVYDALGGTRGVFQTNDLIYQYLGFRGFSRLGDYGNRVLVTLDGHTMNDDLAGSSYVGYDFMSDLMDVERIEVVRGPGSALYGSNAFFGVINVVTRDRDTLAHPHVSAAADGTRTARLRANLSGTTADIGGWISAGGVTSQGRDYYFEEFDDGEGDGLSTDADAMNSGTLSGKAWFKDLTAEGFINGRQKRIPNGAFETVLGSPKATSNDLRAFLELRYEPKLSENVQLYSRVYLDRYAFEGVYPYDDDVIGVVTDSWQGAWVGAEPRVVATLVKGLTLTAGAEARFDYQSQLDGQDASGTYQDDDVNFQVYSGYAVIQGSSKRVEASLGARLDRFTYTYPNPDVTIQPEAQTAINPRAAVILKPTEDDVVKVLGGRAFRAPSAYELNYDDGGYIYLLAGSKTAEGEGGDALRPEIIYTGELEYNHRFTDVTSIVASTYYNRISDLIDTAEGICCSVDDPELDVYQYQNTDDLIQTVGEELELRRSWREGWMVSASQSFQHTREGALADGAPISNSPVHLLAVKAAAPFAAGSGSSLSTRLRFETGRRTQVRRVETASAILWDLTLTGEIPQAKLSYGIGVRNVLDWKIEHPANPDYRQVTQEQPGRTFWATLTETF